MRSAPGPNACTRWVGLTGRQGVVGHWVKSAMRPEAHACLEGGLTGRLGVDAAGLAGRRSGGAECRAPVHPGVDLHVCDRRTLDSPGRVNSANSKKVEMRVGTRETAGAGVGGWGKAGASGWGFSQNGHATPTLRPQKGPAPL